MSIFSDLAKSRSLRLAAAASLSLVAALGCERSEPDRSQTGQGRAEDSQAQSESSQTTRVVPLSPALAVILRDLGLENLVVARHGFDLVLDESLPVAGDQTGIDYEILRRVEPTHVLLEKGADELPPRLMEFAERQGWTVQRFTLLTLDDIRSATQRLASMLGDEEARSRARTLLERMDRAWSPREDLARRAGRTLALYWTRPPGAAGPESFHFQMLKALGVTPAIEQGGPYITLDAEDVRRLDPDSLVLFMPEAEPDRLEELLGPLSRLDLRAVRKGRVAVINHPLCQTPSTAMVEVTERLVEKIRSW